MVRRTNERNERIQREEFRDEVSVFNAGKRTEMGTDVGVDAQKDHGGGDGGDRGSNVGGNGGLSEEVLIVLSFYVHSECIISIFDNIIHIQTDWGIHS
jgi:hypothetical protein